MPHPPGLSVRRTRAGGRLCCVPDELRPRGLGENCLRASPMRRSNAAIVIAACTLGWSPALTAASAAEGTSELESMLAMPVYAASKYQQSVADAPAAVTIIT